MKPKFLLLLSLSVIVTVCADAQLKHFLPRTDAVMSIFDHKFWFEGDTIVNNVRYTKVYKQKCTSETDCGELIYYAAVREDTIRAKIYAIYNCDPVEGWTLPAWSCDEVLLADFDVQKGDHVEVCTRWPAFSGMHKVSATVDYVDSVWINDHYRRRVNLVVDFGHPQRTPDSWVEGFGSIVYGLFSPHANPYNIVDGGNTPMFLCLHIKGELYYEVQYDHPPLYDCFLPDIGGYSIPNISFYEEKNYFFIENDLLYLNDNYVYQIFDARGSIVSNGIYAAAPINVSLWTKGVYLIQLYYDNEPVYFGKFVKF